MNYLTNFHKPRHQFAEEVIKNLTCNNDKSLLYNYLEIACENSTRISDYLG